VAALLALAVALRPPRGLRRVAVADPDGGSPAFVALRERPG
jgi:hypothetical protein